uniref:Uncharacterized protein n=1 Tax=Anguilla anguilla TaxID=7936 RepID=A0A0E9TWL6_ANGAN
MRTQPVERAPF